MCISFAACYTIHHFILDDASVTSRCLHSCCRALEHASEDRRLGDFFVLRARKIEETPYLRRISSIFEEIAPLLSRLLSDLRPILRDRRTKMGSSSIFGAPLRARLSGFSDVTSISGIRSVSIISIFEFSV